MIREVALERSTWNDAPWKFEAGTPDVAGAIGFGAAIAYLEAVGMDAIEAHDKTLAGYAIAKLSAIPGLKIAGPTAGERVGAVSFTIEGLHPHDLATLLDREGVAIRGGHHCAMPLHARLGLPATARASFYLYNDEADVDRLVEAIGKAKETMKT